MLYHSATIDPGVRYLPYSQVVDFATGARLPATRDLGVMARAGRLMAYAPIIIHHYEVVAGYVGKS